MELRKTSAGVLVLTSESRSLRLRIKGWNLEPRQAHSVLPFPAEAPPPEHPARAP